MVLTLEETFMNTNFISMVFAVIVAIVIVAFIG